MHRVAAVLAVLISLIPAGRIHFRSEQNVSVRDGHAPPPTIAEVRGDVENAGVYLLHGPDAATIRHAMDAAGGLNGSDESPSRVSDDLALAGRPIHTGELVRVTRQEDGKPLIRIEAMDAAAMLTLGLRLDPNRLTERELSLVPGMKPDFAACIVKRRENRPWGSLWELEEIPGVGHKTAEKWKEYLYIPR